MTSNQDYNGKLGPSNYLGSHLFGVATMICALWIVFAPWFSAHNIISLVPERQSCWVAILAVIFFGDIYARRPFSGIGFRRRLLRWCVFLCALLVVFCGEVYSSDLFVYWKVRAISPNDWAQMASDLQKIGEVSANNNRRIRPQELPKSLQPLGCAKDYLGGTGGWGAEDSGGNDFRAEVEWGNKLRVWGLFIATNKITREQFAANYLKAINVAPDSFFFLRPAG